MDAKKTNSGSQRWRIALSLSCLIGITGISVNVFAADPASGDDWTTHGGTLQGTRYSALTDITPANAGTLVEEFSFQTGVNGSHMGAPLVVNTTINGQPTTLLILVTPYPNKLLAYNLGTGLLQWTYTPSVMEYAKGVNCCDTVNRGPAYAFGKIVFNTLDDTTVAVNVADGTVAWRTRLADPHTGVTTNGVALIVPDKADPTNPAKARVFVGSSSGEMGVRGWVQALNLSTGAMLWRAYTTGSDADVMIGAGFHAFYPKDQGTDLGITSWPGTAWQQGGSSVWGYLTYDPDLDLIFYGTSQPGVWNPDLRPGDNKWGTSIFARNATTGQAAWAYQVTPHDNWDFDSVSESVPINLPATSPITVNGTPHTKVLVHFDKNGFVYTFDRGTGEILSAPAFGYQNWAPGGIDLTTGLPRIDGTKFTHQGVTTSNICPSALGLKGWEPSAYSPQTGLFYVPTFNLCMSMTMLKAEYIAGAPYMGQDMAISAGQPPYNMSELVAWDFVNGKKAWGIPEGPAIYSGILATAGGVVFYGTMDNAFKAVDAATGTSLITKQLECSTVGSPISFKGPDGKQRIAAFSGVGWLAGGFSAGGACPGKGSTAINGGGRVHVFKLP